MLVPAVGSLLVRMQGHRASFYRQARLCQRVDLCYPVHVMNRKTSNDACAVDTGENPVNPIVRDGYHTALELRFEEEVAKERNKHREIAKKRQK